MNITQRNRKALLLLKIGISAALVYWLLSRAEYVALVDAARSLSILQVGAVIGVHLAAFAIGGLRWWLLLRHLHAPIALRQTLPSYYLGIFANNFLPSGAGGDVVRTVHLALRGLDAKALIGSAIADRVLGLFVVVFMATAGAAASPDLRLDATVRHTLVGLALCLSAVALFVLTPLSRRVIEAVRRRYEHTRLRRFVIEVLQLSHSYAMAPRVVALGLVLSAAMQVLVICVYYLLGRMLGIELSIVTYCAIIPLVFLAVAVPISVGGLGVREGTLTALFVASGVPPQTAIALSLAYLLVLWLASLPGAAVLLARTRRAPRLITP